MAVDVSARALHSQQGGERLGNETSDLIFVQCEMRSRTGTSALSPLFRCVIKSANRKSIFLSVNIFLKCIIIKQVFDRLATLLSEFMSVMIIINISQRKLHKFYFSLKLLNVYFRLLTFFFYYQIQRLFLILSNPKSYIC